MFKLQTTVKANHKLKVFKLQTNKRQTANLNVQNTNNVERKITNYKGSNYKQFKGKYQISIIKLQRRGNKIHC